jgi:serine/threonine protein kinase
LDLIAALTIERIHQDIQPANILVFHGDTDSPYDVSFKLADFGLAEIVKIVEGEGAIVPVDNEGNRMYCECSSLLPTSELGLTEFLLLKLLQKLTPTTKFKAKLGPILTPSWTYGHSGLSSVTFSFGP